jgi:streptogramin lyase
MDDLKNGRLVAAIDVGGAPDAPDWQVVGTDAVSVANSSLGAVERIDPVTNTVVAKVPVTQPCDGLGAGFGSIWVPDCASNSLVRIDERTSKVTATIALPGIGDGSGEGLIGVGAGGVWVLTDDQGTLARVDPATNKVAAQYQLPDGSVAAVLGAGSVWVATYQASTIERLDPTNGKVVATIQVSSSPRFMAYGFDALWVLGQGEGDVTRIDPATNHVAATIAVELPGEGGCIGAGEGGVWVTMPGTPLSRDRPGNEHRHRAVHRGWRRLPQRGIRLGLAFQP